MELCAQTHGCRWSAWCEEGTRRPTRRHAPLPGSGIAHAGPPRLWARVMAAPPAHLSHVPGQAGSAWRAASPCAAAGMRRSRPPATHRPTGPRESWWSTTARAGSPQFLPAHRTAPHQARRRRSTCLAPPSAGLGSERRDVGTALPQGHVCRPDKDEPRFGAGMQVHLAAETVEDISQGRGRQLQVDCAGRLDLAPVPCRLAVPIAPSTLLLRRRRRCGLESGSGSVQTPMFRGPLPRLAAPPPADREPRRC